MLVSQGRCDNANASRLVGRKAAGNSRYMRLRKWNLLTANFDPKVAVDPVFTSTGMNGILTARSHTFMITVTGERIGAKF
jgi:hypothetical protein